jgi:hypothetical protein
MRIRCGSLTLLVVLMATRSLPALADDATARAVVDKGIKAMGPAEVLAKYKADAWKARGKMTMMGQTLPYTCEYMFQAPDRFRFVMDGEFGGQKIRITAAGAQSKAWEQAAGQVRDMLEPKLKEFNHNIYTIWVSMLTPLKDPAFKLTSLGDVKSIDGHTQAGVKVSREGQRDVSLFFDKSTGLLTRSLTWVMDEFSNKEVTQEVVFSDYKNKDGVMQFGKMTILRDGKPFIEEEIFDQKGLEKLDEALFGKP